MKLLFKQRFFSWFDSYDIFNESGMVVYNVRGQFSWGHCLKIFDVYGNEVGTVKEKILTWMPKFEIYHGNTYMGCINREWSFFKPKYNIDCNGWHVQGDFFEWDYKIFSPQGLPIATVSKEIFNWTDTYSIDVVYPQDALCVLMLVLAIDAEKCSRE